MLSRDISRPCRPRITVWLPFRQIHNRHDLFREAVTRKMQGAASTIVPSICWPNQGLWRRQQLRKFQTCYRGSAAHQHFSTSSCYSTTTWGTLWASMAIHPSPSRALVMSNRITCSLQHSSASSSLPCSPTDSGSPLTVDIPGMMANFMTWSVCVTRPK